MYTHLHTHSLSLAHTHSLSLTLAHTLSLSLSCLVHQRYMHPVSLIWVARLGSISHGAYLYLQSHFPISALSDISLFLSPWSIYFLDVCYLPAAAGCKSTVSEYTVPTWRHCVRSQRLGTLYGQSARSVVVATLLSPLGVVICWMCRDDGS